MRDNILSAIGLAIFLVVAYVVGGWLNRFKNAKFRRAWAPLLPLLQDAKVVDDGGGAATSWLTGTYRGHHVQAWMTPQRNLYSGESGGARFNDFALSLANLKGEQDWDFQFRSTPEPGKSPWRVTADTTALAQRLERAGIESQLPGLGFPKITFQRQGGLLQYQVDVTPALVPPPDAFRRTLDFLIWMADVNRQVNTPA